MYGMSVEKFKRILKVLIAEHVYQNDDYFFVHNVQLGLYSKKEYAKIHEKLLKEVTQGFDEFHKELEPGEK